MGRQDRFSKKEAGKVADFAVMAVCALLAFYLVKPFVVAYIMCH